MRVLPDDDRYPKMLTFIEKYAPNNNEKLSLMLETSKVPSKKKLIILLAQFPKLKDDSLKVLESGKLLQCCLSKRKKRIRSIASVFMKSYSMLSDNIDKLRHDLGENMAHMPWSITEINSSIVNLRKIFKECNERKYLHVQENEGDDVLNKNEIRNQRSLSLQS